MSLDEFQKTVAGMIESRSVKLRWGVQGITADNKKNRVNSDIDVSQVQLIGAEGENMGVVDNLARVGAS